MNESAAKDADEAVREAMTFLEKRAEARDTLDNRANVVIYRGEHPIVG